jgi:hypothetical protein
VVSLDDDPLGYDAEVFEDAAEAFLRRLPLDVPMRTVADTLRFLCEAGHLVSPIEYERERERGLIRLHECEQAATEMTERLHADGSIGINDEEVPR